MREKKCVSVNISIHNDNVVQGNTVIAVPYVAENVDI